MASTLPPPPEVAWKPVLGPDDVSAPGNVMPKTEPTELMPLPVSVLPSHTSSQSPAPDSETRQDSCFRTTPSNLSPAQAPSASDTNRRLPNVRDALMYLDAVKAQFANSPEVYNMFLVILTQFKTEQLDTPGVALRVSSLFGGYPFLIEGFNTFMPAGYHIQCSTDLQINTIIVTTPTRTHTTHTEVINYPQPPLVPMPDLSPVLAPAQRSMLPTAYPAPTTGISPGSPFGHVSRGATGLSDVQSGDREGTPFSPEVTNAIAFINRVKARYEHDIDVYEAFLELLLACRQKLVNGHDFDHQNQLVGAHYTVGANGFTVGDTLHIRLEAGAVCGPRHMQLVVRDAYSIMLD